MHRGQWCGSAYRHPRPHPTLPLTSSASLGKGFISLCFSFLTCKMISIYMYFPVL